MRRMSTLVLGATLLAALATRGVSVETALLAALACAWAGEHPLYVELESHGRDEVVQPPPAKAARSPSTTSARACVRTPGV